MISKCYSEDEGECHEALLLSKMRCPFKYHLLVNMSIENLNSSEEDGIFRVQSKVIRRNNLAIMQMPF